MGCCTVQKSNVEQLNLNCGVRYTSLRTLELFKLKTYITVYLLLLLLPSLVKKKNTILFYKIDEENLGCNNLGFTPSVLFMKE